METRYIFITGGVVSSLGKGIATSSIGALLRARGYRVTAVKIDPYINVDAGTMKPFEHGEVFVTGDGAETDLDLGTYERFLDIDLSRENSITTGQVYLKVIERERAGDYLSQTVQVIPHVTDEIKERIRAAGRQIGAEIVLVEVGGTVGDIESLPFLEAIRQMRFEEGRRRTLYLHVTLLPYLGSSEEFKTKPTQHSVAALRGFGIQPDGLVLRSISPLPADARRKIALFTNVEARDVFNSADADFVYALPAMFEQQGMGRFIERGLKLEKTVPDLRAWQEAVEILRTPDHVVRIGVVGKYTAMPDAYLSLLEALRHAGISNRSGVETVLVSAEDLEGDTDPAEILHDLHGILIPGGFGSRGMEGKIRAARFARENNIPFLGICLQAAVIEFARNVAGLTGADSTEFPGPTDHPVIDLLPGQADKEGTGGTMRLGSWPMRISDGTRLAEIYGASGAGLVHERHRHRYEVNPAYVDRLTDAGLVVSGVTPGRDGHGEGLVEAIELSGHPYFVALQSHPELKSRLLRPSPPFNGLIQAARKRADGQEAS